VLHGGNVSEQHDCVIAGRVLGVDACSAGWVAVALARGDIRAYVGAQIGPLVSAAMTDGGLQVIGIDIPIGLPDRGVRAADLQARAAAGPRRASVFITPVRRTLATRDYRAACDLNRLLTGHAISRQAFNLLAKIKQVDDWLNEAPCQVVEVHPELSFAAMACGPLPASKSSWAGLVARRHLLADAGIELADDLGQAGVRAGADDVLDAAAAAWTANRVVTGRAVRLPAEAEAERFSDQIDCAIWT
jgi:predicted RNase H-like nuclease